MIQDIFSQSKILGHWDRLTEWVNNNKSVPPITVELHPTNVCPHKCPDCTFNNVDRRRNLPKVFANEIVNDLGDYGVRGIVITGGGEPFAINYLVDLVHDIKEKGMKCGIMTNGDLITNQTDHDLASMVKECEFIRVSVDAATQEQHSKIHGVKNRFDKVLSGVDKLVKVRKELSKKAGYKPATDCRIGAAYLTRSDTKPEMSLFALKMRELGVDYVQFRPFHNVFDDCRREIEAAKAYETGKFKVLGSMYKYELFNKPLERSPCCYSHNFETAIGADRKLYLCCHLVGNERYVLGDLDVKTFKEIWEGDNRQEIIKNHNYEDCPIMCKSFERNKMLYEIKRMNSSQRDDFL